MAINKNTTGYYLLRLWDREGFWEFRPELGLVQAKVSCFPVAHPHPKVPYCTPAPRPYKVKPNPLYAYTLKKVLPCSFSQVMMKDISTPVPPDEFRKEIRNCLHQAALVNYTRVSAYAKIEGGS